MGGEMSPQTRRIGKGNRGSRGRGLCGCGAVCVSGGTWEGSYCTTYNAIEHDLSRIGTRCGGWWVVSGGRWVAGGWGEGLDTLGFSAWARCMFFLILVTLRKSCLSSNTS